MNAWIYFLCLFLNKTLNIGILLLGAFEVFLLVKTWQKLAGLRKQIDKINGSRSRETWRNVGREKGKLTTEFTSRIEHDWTEFDRFYNQYQKDGRWYSAFTLIIQLFTLLGILGTVAGLFIAMQGNADWTNAQGIYQGVRFALSSTVLGIILAVIFKVFEIIIHSLYVNYIEDGIQRFTNNYNEEKDLPYESG